MLSASTNRNTVNFDYPNLEISSRLYELLSYYPNFHLPVSFPHFHLSEPTSCQISSASQKFSVFKRGIINGTNQKMRDSA